jgi:anaerobic selenocysteine-containing dehydrogenase
VESSKQDANTRAVFDAEKDEDASLARGVPGAEPPPERQDIELGKRDRSAAGFTSIYETARHGFAKMGVGRTFRTLLTINQKDGFDCPSCAWPDPDGDRKMAEFCENGAKAVVSEATLERAEPSFFAANSIPSMLDQSDYWLEQQGRITHPMLR